MYRWQCHHCAFTGWGRSRSTLATRIQTHLYDHHCDRLTRRQGQTEWSCPYCEQRQVRHDSDSARRDFARHLLGHTKATIEADTHIADTVDWAGTILVVTSPDRPPATTAHDHFLAPADRAILVTRTPRARLQLLTSCSDPPIHTTLIGPDDTSTPDIAAEIDGATGVTRLTVDSPLELATLGETIGEALRSHPADSGNLTVAVDCVSHLATTCGLDTTVAFLHTLSTRLAEADALTHYYVDPTAEATSLIHLIGSLCDLTLNTTDDLFLAYP